MRGVHECRYAPNKSEKTYAPSRTNPLFFCSYLCSVKKLTIIAILVFYSLAAFGVSLNYFYCCGKLKEVSVKLNPPVNHNCPMKGEGGKDCCKNEKVDLKISADQNISQQIVFEPLVVGDALVLNDFELSQQLFSQQYRAYTLNRPPPLSQPHLHLLNCSFLI